MGKTAGAAFVFSAWRVVLLTRVRLVVEASLGLIGADSSICVARVKSSADFEWAM
jgi:hypothetical protein